MTNSVLPGQSYSVSPLDVKGNLHTEQYWQPNAPTSHTHTHRTRTNPARECTHVHVDFSMGRCSNQQTWLRREGFYLPLERVLHLTRRGNHRYSCPHRCEAGEGAPDAAPSTQGCVAGQSLQSCIHFWKEYMPPPWLFGGCKVRMGYLKQPQPSCRGEGTSFRTLRLSESKKKGSLVAEEPLI